jgi:hypothetical protein
VSVALIGSFLIAALPKTGWAGEDVSSPATVDLRAAIDRAAVRTIAASRDDSSGRDSRAAARARQSVGGGGGSMMMVWTVLGTVTGLATTYFVVKEMRKQTEQTTAGQ